MRRLLASALPVTLAGAAFAPAPAHAALPMAKAKYETHDHRTKGDNWHVEAEVSRGRRTLRTLVIYAQRCDGATAYAERVHIAADGSVASGRPIDADRPRQGSWSLNARFVSRSRLEGTWRIVTPTCDTGHRPFVATSKADGHKGHQHGGGHRHYGHPQGTMPDLRRGSRRARAQARRLWRATLRAARTKYPTYAAARRAGFVRFPRDWPKPVVFHLRRLNFERDAHHLEATRPESLVYHWGKNGSPVLVAFMYRVPAGRHPAFAKPLLAWHQHFQNGRWGKTQMTHVWLTGDLRSALANCMPVAQLEKAIPAYRYEGKPIGAMESLPCPDDAAS